MNDKATIIDRLKLMRTAQRLFEYYGDRTEAARARQRIDQLLDAYNTAAPERCPQ